MVALQSLKNDQVAIAGLQVEVNDLKNAADNVMDMVVPQVAREERKPVIDRPIDLLRATSLTLAMESLVRVKSHFPEVDMVKVWEGPDEVKHLGAIEVVVQPTAE